MLTQKCHLILNVLSLKISYFINTFNVCSVNSLCWMKHTYIDSKTTQCVFVKIYHLSK